MLISNTNMFSTSSVFSLGGCPSRMSKSETEEMIEIEIDGQDKQECLEET